MPAEPTATIARMWSMRKHGPGVLVRITTVLALASCAHPAQAQIRKLGPEFQVNSYTKYLQEQPRVETSGRNSFLIVWLGSSPSPSESYEIRGQLFDRRYGRRSGEFFVSRSGVGDHRSEQYPALARTGRKGFVVAWESYSSIEDIAIGAERLNAEGAAIGSGVSVNTTPTPQKRPSVASDPSGNFVVAWINRPIGANYAPRVRVRNFRADGTPITPERPLTLADRHARDVNVAMRPDGTSIVVWHEDGTGILGQQFDGSGSRIGDIFIVSYSGNGRPDIATTATGEFVIVWQGYGIDGSGYGIFGRRFDRDGLGVSDDFQVNSYSADQQTNPSVATNATGEFVVVWESYASVFEEAGGQDGSGRGVFGQYFAEDGEPLGREFQANTFVRGDQGNRRVRESDVAIWRDGEFVVTWTSPEQDGDATGVFAQLFSRDPLLGAVCGDAANSDLLVRSPDALAVLRASLGLFPCELCLCDADRSGIVTTADALTFLRVAVGVAPSPSCPPCTE